MFRPVATGVRVTRTVLAATVLISTELRVVVPAGARPEFADAMLA